VHDCGSTSGCHVRADFRQLKMQMLFPRPLSVFVVLVVAGCASISSQIVPCPLTYSEQTKEVLNVVPKGTRREDALRKLAQAGIEGSFGISRRVYYCELWTRPDGSRWHLNVALLFDETGKVYKTQAADSEVTASPEKSLPPNGPQSNEPGLSGGPSSRSAQPTR
jgi:hypothetical protein